MATNVRSFGQRTSGRPAGSGKQLPQGATLGVTAGIKGRGVPANVRPLLAPVSKGGRTTTNTQPT